MYTTAQTRQTGEPGTVCESDDMARSILVSRTDSNRLRLESPDDETMHVSHETIYRSLFVQGRGELRRDSPVVFVRGKVNRMVSIQRSGADCATW